MAVEFCDLTMESLYKQLLAEFPDAHPDTVEASLYFLRIAASKHLRLESLFSEYGLSSGRFSLLMLLRQQPDRQLSPSELAKRAQVSRATMTHFIDHLEKDQFIIRVDDPNDRRSMLIRLTAHAESVLKKVIPIHLRDLEQVTHNLNRTERKQLFQLMLKLTGE